MNKEITLTIPVCAANTLICERLTTSAVCSLLSADIDLSEDIKVCVNEACLMLMGYKYKNIKITYTLNDNLVINVEGQGICKVSNYDINKEFVLALINSLVDKVDYNNNNSGVLSSITLTKRIK